MKKANQGRSLLGGEMGDGRIKATKSIDKIKHFGKKQSKGESMYYTNSNEIQKR